ncbi:uncharacterized protein LOC114362550 [Ostrinia furnacalis]|uniref:uncharacterized protein LOC114362550 n=1 Tax=Ostrinia furnacalis TaxID=93504 RepID=UPI00103FEF20|nr:uncharacterized protein LOC114362550 [Ostrinia furnacalis]
MIMASVHHFTAAYRCQEAPIGLLRLPRMTRWARRGGGRSFQHRDAANLNDPRKAAVRCLGVANMMQRVIWAELLTLSRDRRACATGKPARHHSCGRRHAPASSSSTSTGGRGTPRAPGGTAGGWGASGARSRTPGRSPHHEMNNCTKITYLRVVYSSTIIVVANFAQQRVPEPYGLETEGVGEKTSSVKRGGENGLVGGAELT